MEPEYAKGGGGRVGGGLVSEFHTLPFIFPLLMCFFEAFLLSSISLSHVPCSNRHEKGFRLAILWQDQDGAMCAHTNDGSLSLARKSNRRTLCAYTVNIEKLY